MTIWDNPTDKIFFGVNKQKSYSIKTLSDLKFEIVNKIRENI